MKSILEINIDKDNGGFCASIEWGVNNENMGCTRGDHILDFVKNLGEMLELTFEDYDIKDIEIEPIYPDWNKSQVDGYVFLLKQISRLNPWVAKSAGLE